MDSEKYAYIEENIIISDEECALDKSFIENNHIEVIINLTKDAKFIDDITSKYSIYNDRYISREFVNYKLDKYHFPLIDNEDQIDEFVEILPKVAKIIDIETKKGRKILIHCKAGINRSPTALATYYILYKNMGVIESIEHIRKNKIITFTDYYLIKVLNIIKSTI